MLRSSLQQTLSPQADVRKGAERFLESVASQKGFVLVVLQVLEGANESMDVRLAAALLFKNFIKKSWDPEKQGCVAPDEKEVVKQHIVELMCRMPETIQKQLIEALATIGEYDFPHAWQTLLAELVAKLKVETDWQVRNGVLMTANTIFKRFRNVFRSDSLYSELKHCLEVFQEPLLQFFLQTGNELRVANAPKPQQLQMMAALRIMTRIFYSLNWQDLPEYFEDHISEWMTAFLSYFEYVNPALIDADNEDEPDPIDLLLVAIVENVNLYADKYDEEFKPYLEQFTQVIWNLLANRISLMPKHDELAAKCMKFLTLVSSRAIHRHVFSSPAVLAEMCNIVVKNLQLRSSDEELFEDNAMEYIRRDIEGSDGDSRRSAARDLVRGLLNSFSEQVTGICMKTIQTHLQQYRADPAGSWALKDVSVNLVIAISALKQSRLRGVSEVNALVPILDFYTSEVWPELTNASTSPIVKAGAIKFVSTFRNQLPVEAMEKLFPVLMNCMEPKQFVVHTYAAACVERLLTVKDNGVIRFPRSRLLPYLDKLLGHLFAILQQPEYPENDYLMRLVMRLVSVAKDDILPYADTVVDQLTRILNSICANPSNPTFSHYLFEALSALVLNVCSKEPAATERFEALLFPPFEKVLANDVEALSPYVYQMFAQMLELRPSGVSQAYMSMFPILLSPMLWERVSNAPAIVKLLEAYMRKAPQDVSSSAQGILGVFQKLISSRTTEAFGFSLLRGFIAFLPATTYQGFLNEIIKILMIRLQSRMAGRSPDAFVVELLHTLSVLVGKLGPDALVSAMESLQPGLICEANMIMSDIEMWQALLSGIIRVLAEDDTSSVVKDTDDMLEDLEQTGYEAGYSKLHFASVVPSDLLVDYPPAKGYFVSELAKLSAMRPGVYLAHVQQHLSPKETELLQAMFLQYNATFQ
ncbi:hypothetical protein ATCC90586_000696 [Pythium insidiosum]|nr:hypothetical protein ATCC90586_000696 [Pythium insidiosum]